MNAGPGMSFLLNQLMYQGPTMLVCLVAVVLAMVNMERAKLPSILTLTGAGILVISGIGFAALQSTIVASRPNNLGQTMQIIGLMASCTRAVGLGLLVAAVFVGRTEAYPPDDREEED